MARQIHEKASASDFEVDSQDLHLRSKVKTLRVIDSARVGLTVVALLMGITVLGVSADALAVYDSTHVGRDFLLPLWPDNFNLRPTVALVVGAAIVVISNVVSLLSSKVQTVSLLTSSASLYDAGCGILCSTDFPILLASSATKSWSTPRSPLPRPWSA